MPAAAPPIAEDLDSDATDLQTVLTRYVDSYDGYTEAAKVIESSSLAGAFLEIAARRKSIVEQVSSLILKQGETPDQKGSPEAAVHRWWIRVRAQMTEEDFKATLEECVRGEQELARTVQAALDKGHLSARHAEILTHVADELLLSLRTFKSAIDP